MQKHVHDPKSKTKSKAKSKSKPKAETQAETPTAKRDEERQHAAEPARESEEDRGGAAEPARGMEGEGNYTAGRRYDDSVRDFVGSGEVESSAREAKRAVEGPEAEELSAAERVGKRGEPDEDSE